LKPTAKRPANSPIDRKRFAIMPSAVRSAIANGSKLLDNLDARSAPARRFRDVQNDIARDISGGIDHLTEAQLQLVRTAAGLVVMRESFDTAALNGEEVSVSEYCRVSNSLRRVLATIGFNRVPRDITPRPLRERLLDVEEAQG
jgi:hypothetical protein